MKAECNMNDLAKRITIKIKVKGIITFKVRTWAGLQIMKFGAWVTGMGVEVETDGP